MDERWLPVVGYEGYYEVSNQGNVRTVARTLTTKAGVKKPVRARILKAGTTNHGYRLVVLSKDARGCSYLVHRLVAEAFIGPRPKGADIRHADGTRTNNQLTNLSYGTRSENIYDSVEHGTWNNMNTGKTHCLRGHEFTTANTYVPPPRRKGMPERMCRTCANERRRKRPAA
jgi:hypothetical protein